MNGRGAEAVVAASVCASSGALAAGDVHNSGAGQLAIGCASGTCRASGIVCPRANSARERKPETRPKQRITRRMRTSFPESREREALRHSRPCPYSLGGLLPEVYVGIAEERTTRRGRHTCPGGPRRRMISDSGAKDSFALRAKNRNPLWGSEPLQLSTIPASWRSGERPRS